MEVIRDNNTLLQWIRDHKQMGRRIGFVPTMGALHQGHLSLVRACSGQSDITVCSIFVNPTQFNDPEDLEKYPRNTDRDSQLLKEADTDLLYLPEVESVYPQGMEDWTSMDFGTLEEVLEGACRPSHFQGVAQVVSRLLELVQPNDLYLGQKDFQQVAILRRMLEMQSSPICVHVVPIVRELHGLAMSSRNERLSPIDRMRAGKLYEALTHVQIMFEENTPIDEALKSARRMLERPGFSIEYFEVCERSGLERLSSWGREGEMVALVACWVGEVRLIDNILL